MTIKGAMEAEIRFRNQKEPSLILDENQYINAIGNNGTDFDHVMIHAACNVPGVVIRKYTFYDNDEVDLKCYIPRSGIFEDIISLLHHYHKTYIFLWQHLVHCMQQRS